MKQICMLFNGFNELMVEQLIISHTELTPIELKSLQYAYISGQ